MASRHEVVELAVEVEAARHNVGAQGNGLAELLESYQQFRPLVIKGAEGQEFLRRVRALMRERNR